MKYPKGSPALMGISQNAKAQFIADITKKIHSRIREKRRIFHYDNNPTIFLKIFVEFLYLCF